MSATMMLAKCAKCRGTGYPVNSFFPKEEDEFWRRRLSVTPPLPKPGDCEPCSGSGWGWAIAPARITP